MPLGEADEGSDSESAALMHGSAVSSSIFSPTPRTRRPALLALSLLLGARSATAAGGCDTPTHNNTMFNQADLKGGHFLHIKSFEACCALCRTHAGCHAYSWGKGPPNNCYLKTGPNQPHADTGAVSSTVGPVPPPGPPPAPPGPAPPGPAPSPAPSPAPPGLHDGWPAFANRCNASSPTQKWDFEGGALVLRGSRAGGYRGFCLSSVANPLAGSECVAGQGAQQWGYNASWKSVVLLGGPKNRSSNGDAQCLTLNGDGARGPGSLLNVDNCNHWSDEPGHIDHGYPARHWNYSAASGMLTDLQTDVPIPLCLDAAHAAPPRACDLEPGRSQPWCDASLQLDARVADLLSRINEVDWPGLFENQASGVPALNIMPYQCALP